MLPLLRERPRSILLIGAHSDDIEIGCGGTVLSLLALIPDLAVHWVVLSGEGTRADEAREGAARFLAGAKDPRFDVLDFPDTAFPYEAMAELKAFFRTLPLDADLVFTHRRDDLHQDHAAVAALTWQRFRDHAILEYEIPKYEGDLGRPNAFVPLTRETAEAKARMTVETFATQMSKPWFDADTLLGLMRVRGNECRAPEGYAEAFHAMKMTLI